MKTLHFYLLRQVLATLVMTVLVFTLVLMLGNVLKDLITLLINRQASFMGVVEAIGLLIPFVLVFALPMGMLTAGLLVFGRFSADQELTAVRSGGISLIALVTPILVLSVLLCGLSAWINMEVAPHCRVAYKNLLNEMEMNINNNALPAGRYVTDVKHYSFFIGSNDGKELRDVFIFHQNNDGDIDISAHADRGYLENSNGQIKVVLPNAHELNRMENGSWVPNEGEYTVVINPFLDQGKSGAAKPSISDMTFAELRVELKNLEQRFSTANFAKVSKEELRKQKHELEEIKTDVTMPVLVQIHRQIAGAFACLGFTLLGIPLGIRAHRRETNIGIAMALGLVFVYYGFIVLGQSLQTHAEFAPYLILWLPNFIFQAVGAVMLWRANRGI